MGWSCRAPKGGRGENAPNFQREKKSTRLVKWGKKHGVSTPRRGLVTSEEGGKEDKDMENRGRARNVRNPDWNRGEKRRSQQSQMEKSTKGIFKSSKEKDHNEEGPPRNDKKKSKRLGKKGKEKKKKITAKKDKG